MAADDYCSAGALYNSMELCRSRSVLLSLSLSLSLSGYGFSRYSIDFHLARNRNYNS